MTRDEAIELIERMPYIRTIQAPNIKIRKEFYNESMAENDPLELIKIIKSVYLRRLDRTLFDGETVYYERAKKLLHSDLSAALDIPYSKVESYITQHLKNTL